MNEYPGCKGCIEYLDCDHAENNKIAKGCPCINCMVKMVCRDLCADYEVYHDAADLLERPLEDGG